MQMIRRFLAAVLIGLIATSPVSSAIGPRRIITTAAKTDLVPSWQVDLTQGVLPASLTYSNTTLGGLLTDSTGKLTYKPNNLLTYSQDFTNAAWVVGGASVTGNATVAPDGTTTAAFLNENTSDVRHLVKTQFLVVSFAYNQTISVYAKAGIRSVLTITAGTGTSTYAAANFDLSAGAVTQSAASGAGYAVLGSSITSVGNGWYRCSITVSVGMGAQAIFAPSNTTTGIVAYGLVAYTGVVGNGLYVWGAQVAAVTYQTTPSSYVATTSSAYYGPAFDYDPVSVGTPLGLRVWESRTNLFTYSGRLDNAVWSKSGTNVSGAATTAPDGTTNGTKLSTTSASSTNFNVYTGYISGNGSYTATVYAKAGTLNFVDVGLVTPTTKFNVICDLTSGAIKNFYSSGSPTGTAFSATPVGNGWYRIAVTQTVTTSVLTYFGLSNSYSPTINVNGEPFFTGTGAENVYLWGAQLENAAFASPYIPTSSAAVTAAADVVTLGGVPLGVLTGNAGSAVEELSGLLGTVASNQGILGNGNPSIMYRDSATNNLDSYNFRANGQGVGPGIMWAGTIRTGIAFDANGASLVGNGGTAVSRSGTQAFSGTMYLGSSGSSTFINGYIRKLALYNSRLPDATLKAKTVSGAPF